VRSVAHTPAVAIIIRSSLRLCARARGFASAAPTRCRRPTTTMATATSPPAGPRPITHVLFDMDGLLLDTETCYSTAQAAMLKPYGRQFTPALKAQMMGRTALEAARVLIDAFEPPLPLTPAEVLAQRDALLAGLFPKAGLMPGAARLVAHLRACGVPAAVATSSHARHFELKTSAHRAFFEGGFDHVVTGCQVTNGKPHPEIFQAAAAQWSPPPTDPAGVLVFEDAPAGVAAARAAGMAVCFVPDARHLPPEDAERAAALADVTISSLEEWRPEEWGLKPFEEK
jgi:(DL)-glycerol-3-phosphatase